MVRLSQISPDLRKAVESRGRFADFKKTDCYQQSVIFEQAGYSKVTSLRQRRENDRAFFFFQNIRKMTGPKVPPVAVRLVLDLVGVFHVKMENIKDPMIEEVQIPNQMAKWAPSLVHLAGILTPDQDMVNHFTI